MLMLSRHDALQIDCLVYGGSFGYFKNGIIPLLQVKTLGFSFDFESLVAGMDGIPQIFDSIFHYD